MPSTFCLPRTMRSTRGTSSSPPSGILLYTRYVNFIFKLPNFCLIHYEYFVFYLIWYRNIQCIIINSNFLFKWLWNLFLCDLIFFLVICIYLLTIILYCLYLSCMILFFYQIVFCHLKIFFYLLSMNFFSFPQTASRHLISTLPVPLHLTPKCGVVNDSKGIFYSQVSDSRLIKWSDGDSLIDCKPFKVCWSFFFSFVLRFRTISRTIEWSKGNSLIDCKPFKVHERLWLCFFSCIIISFVSKLSFLIISKFDYRHFLPWKQFIYLRYNLDEMLIYVQIMISFRVVP